MDIAEPLISFDAEKTALEAREFMLDHGIDVIGVRKNGSTVGFALVEELKEGTCGDYLSHWLQTTILEETTSLRDAIQSLSHSEHCFISVLGEISAIVSRGHIQKPPVRMWLFGMISILEMFFTEKIQEMYPDDTWKNKISAARRHKAEQLLQERLRRRQYSELIDCLQLSDKARILIKNPGMRAEFGFKSIREADRGIKNLESLRNNLAHAQDIVSYNWETILTISNRLDTIVSRI